MKLQVIGVIDDAGDVGVLEIDAQREMVRAAHEGALIGMVDVAHRGRSTGPGARREVRGTEQRRSGRVCALRPGVLPQERIALRLDERG